MANKPCSKCGRPGDRPGQRYCRACFNEYRRARNPAANPRGPRAPRASAEPRAITPAQRDAARVARQELGAAQAAVASSLTLHTTDAEPTAKAKTRYRMIEYEKLRQRGVGPIRAARAVGWSDQMFRNIKATYRTWYAAIEGLKTQPETIIGLADRMAEDIPPVPSFADFRREVFGLDTPPHLERFIEHLEFCDCKRLLALFPPEHAKTTVLNRDYPAYLACKERWMVANRMPYTPFRLAVLSQTTDYARTIGWQIREAFTDSEGFEALHRWGPFRGAKKWAEDQIYFAWRTGEEKDPSIQWKGWKNQLQGARLTHLFLDDVDTPEHGEAERNKILVKFDHTAQRRLGRDGRGIIVGTRVGLNDIYFRLRKRVHVPGSPWHELILPALDEHGRPLWPERFDARYFEEVRAEMQNDPLYYLVYQQIDSLGTAAVFDQASLEAAKKYEVGLARPFEAGITIAGIDPAPDGPWSAIVVSWLPAENPLDQKLRVLDVLWNSTGGHNEMRRAVEWCLSYRPAYMGIEKQGGMAMFVGDELENRIAALNCQVSYVPTTAQGMVDQEYGLTAMASWVRREQIEFPWSEGARHAVAPLVDELARYHPTQGGAKDRLMALWFCFRVGLESLAPPLHVNFGPAAQRAPWVRSHQRTIYLQPPPDEGPGGPA